MGRQLQGRLWGAGPRPRLPTAPRDGAAGPGSAGGSGGGSRAGPRRNGARERWRRPCPALRARRSPALPGWVRGRRCPRAGCGLPPGKGTGLRAVADGAKRRRKRENEGLRKAMWEPERLAGPRPGIVAPGGGCGTVRARGFGVCVQFIGPGPEAAMSELGQSGAPCAGAARAQGPCSWQPWV